jgi:flagellar biosynthesis protein FliQ
MNGAEVLDIGRDAIYVLMITAAPIMLVSLFVGLIVSLFQALTQIQEMTLTFVPKILAIFLTMLIFLPFMGEKIGDFYQEIMNKIATPDDESETDLYNEDE